jgi:hypothetical protein
MQKWSENSQTSHNIMIWIHKNPKKVSNDFDQLVLHIPRRDEDLSLSEITCVRQVYFSGDVHHHFLRIT